MYGVIPQEINLIVSGSCWKHLNLEPLPPLVRGSRSRGKKVRWTNKNKIYPSIQQLVSDIRNTYNIIISNKNITDVCKGILEEYKGQKFEFIK